LAAAERGAEHSPPICQQADGTDASQLQVLRSLGMGFQGQSLPQAMAQAGAGQRLIVIGEGAYAVIAAQNADIQRPIRQTALQQLGRSVEREFQRAAVSVDVGHQQLRLSNAIECGQGIELEASGRHALAGLAHAVDIQVDGGRQYRLACERR